MKSVFNKRAEMGVGTLIIFIAFLLVAAVAAGVLIQTAGSLQQKALSTGQEAEGQIATHALIIEVSATDGSTGELDNFTALVKLAPGSNPIKLSDTIFTFNTQAKTGTLKYRTSGTTDLTNQGFNTWRPQILPVVGNATAINLSEDLDDDGVDDTVILTVAQATFVLSTAGTKNIAGSFAGGDSPAISNSPINISGVTYGYLTVSGVMPADATTNATNAFTVTPAKLGQGYYSVAYLQQGTNYINGNLQRGDVLKIYFESPESVGQDQEVRLNFIPKIGTESTVKFFTPDVISTERVYLYP